MNLDLDIIVTVDKFYWLYIIIYLTQIYFYTRVCLLTMLRDPEEAFRIGFVVTFRDLSP